jgi:hypothetical protein
MGLQSGKFFEAQIVHKPQAKAKPATRYEYGNLGIYHLS